MPRAVILAVILLGAAPATLPGAAMGEQATQPSSPAAGYLATGKFHSCAVVASAVRCWGYGGDGALGYGDTRSIGDDETPGSVAPVKLGAGRSAKAISAGDVHTCALLDDGTVRCWGFGANGRLGYGNVEDIGKTASTTPDTAGPVDLDPGPGVGIARAISAGDGHTCAILDNGTVRCWGFGLDGRLGYGNTDTIGDGETPGSVGPVDLDPGPGVGTAKAISAGGFHTCAILGDDTVRCWGFGGFGRLGYGKEGCPGPDDPPPVPPCPRDVGRTADATPDQFGPVDLDPGPGVGTAKAISAGYGYTCAILGNDTVRCWGNGGSGQLGYGNPQNIGDDETPDTVEPVDLDPGSGVGTAKAINAGTEHTCAVLGDDRVRCWGYGPFGRLGYGNASSVGDSQPPGSAGPVDLGPGRTSKAISAGFQHTCARLDDDSVRCWGRGSTGRLGYCDEVTVGDNELPSSAGPVDLGMPGIPGDGCPAAPPPPSNGNGGAPPVPAVAPPASPKVAPLPPAPDPLRAALAAQKVRAAQLRTCLRTAGRKAKADRGRARRLCLRRHGRTPGRVTQLAARATGSRKILLAFRVVGTDGSKAPGARSYLVKQSRRPIRTARDFGRSPSLCKGKCSFKVTRVGATAVLTVTDLRPGLYYYAIAARDNVSGRAGPRSKTIKARAR